MKVSVVATVLNEQDSILELLDSLTSQTKKPDEIVIVDGGSYDETQEIIQRFKEHHHKDYNIHLFVEPGTVAHGRNMAIKHAKNQIIAQTDAGCIAHHDWLEKITEPFRDPKVDLVAGFYKMVSKSFFQTAAAPFFGVVPQDFDHRNFMPSARSIAFRKKVWEKVGGYSESLERAGEDTLFNYQVIKHGIEIHRRKDALVDWEVPKNFIEAIKKFYVYAIGDAQAKIWWHPAQGMNTHNIKITKIFLRYGVGAIFLLLSIFSPFAWLIFISGTILYLFLSFWKFRFKVTDTLALFWSPILQVSSDLAVMAGFLVGTMKR